MTAPQPTPTSSGAQPAATAVPAMHVPLVDLRAQYRTIQAEMEAAIERVMLSCAFAGGPEVELFERMFGDYCKREHCVGLSSGTAALEMLIRAYGIGPGHEVIVPGNTFFATAEGVSITGATPVFIDVEEDTALMDVTKIEAAITPRTKAIIPVHLYGQPCDMLAIMEIAKKHNLIVIEDCAQSHGARIKAKLAGTFGHAAAYSFYPGKNLGAYGEAGAITTDDAAVAEYCRLFREHGSKTKYEHKMVGRNDRMDGIQGAVLGAKLRHLPAWNDARRQWASRYRSLLADDARIRMIQERPGAEGVYHLFVVRVKDRDAVRKKLNDAGVGAGIHYPVPLHLQECYKDLGYKPGSLPVTERLAQEILSLPLYPEIKEEQVLYVVEQLKKAL